MTIQQAQEQLIHQLRAIYAVEEARQIAEMVLEELTGLQRVDQVLHRSQELPNPGIEKLDHFTRELLQNKPIQYVLQGAWFWGMRLYVNEQVLIPRPETEELVDWISKEIRQGTIRPTSLLDIGTGSGCIPLALKKSFPYIDVHACDISEGALEVAKLNATRQQLDVQFHQVNILEENSRRLLPATDLIVSNPPYIPRNNAAAILPNVLEYEPHLALFVEDDDPLLFYRHIAAFARNKLLDNGNIFLEIHEEYAPAVIELFEHDSFKDIHVKADMQGKQRMVRVQK